METDEKIINELDKIGEYLAAEFCLTPREAVLVIYAVYNHRRTNINATIDELRSRCEALALSLAN